MALDIDKHNNSFLTSCCSSFWCFYAIDIIFYTISAHQFLLFSSFVFFYEAVCSNDIIILAFCSLLLPVFAIPKPIFTNNLSLLCGAEGYAPYLVRMICQMRLDSGESHSLQNFTLDKNNWVDKLVVLVKVTSCRILYWIDSIEIELIFQKSIYMVLFFICFMYLWFITFKFIWTWNLTL